MNNNIWNEFLRANKGNNLTIQQLSQKYREQRGGNGLTKLMAKDKLVRYITHLYQMLGLTKTCFLSGAFVIDDQDGQLRNILLKAKDTTLKGILKSHTGFKPYSSGACGGVCEVHIPEFNAKCGSESRIFTSIKWYTFGQYPETERFVYFKLEDMKTFSTEHVKNAGIRYVLKQQAYESTKEKRREDCHKDKEGCKCLSTSGCQYDPSGFLVNKKCIKNISTHKRIGDEFFIPTDVNHGLISGQHIGLCDEEWI